MAQFEVNTSATDGHVVVALAGECDLSARAELTSVLVDAVTRSPVVVVDLGALSFLDSSGIHALVTAYHAARDQGGGIYVRGAVGAVASVLDLTGVADLLRPPAELPRPSADLLRPPADLPRPSADQARPSVPRQ